VQSAGNLKDIGLAMYSHASSNALRLPAEVRDGAGRPLLSWRVELLPYLEEESLFNEFRRDEPWDSPHNKALLKKMPRWYRSRWSDDEGLTRFRVFVGSGTPFERPGLTLTPDGLANTILVVEAAEAVPWTKPEELTYDPAGPLPPLGAGYSKADKFLCYEVRRRPGFNAFFGDGSVRFLVADKVDERSLRALISRNGGEQVDVSRLEE
jgi:hypothetical protein